MLLAPGGHTAPGTPLDPPAREPLRMTLRTLKPSDPSFRNFVSFNGVMQNKTIFLGWGSNTALTGVVQNGFCSIVSERSWTDEECDLDRYWFACSRYLVTWLCLLFSRVLKSNLTSDLFDSAY